MCGISEQSAQHPVGDVKGREILRLVIAQGAKVSFGRIIAPTIFCPSIVFTHPRHFARAFAHGLAVTAVSRLRERTDTENMDVGEQ
jgi:hypothetical protein